jgi:hypothetical protein
LNPGPHEYEAGVLTTVITGDIQLLNTNVKIINGIIKYIIILILYMAMPWLRRLVAGLSQQQPGFAPR